MKGYVHVYTGKGKGKTTAALGLALRAAGAGLRVFIGQFVKARRCGEHDELERFGDCIRIEQYGRGPFIRGEPTAADIQAARQGLTQAEAALASGRYDLVILDEINVATSLGLLAVGDVLGLIRARPPHVELVLTGRGADAEVIQEADLVTEMLEVKHYGHQGVGARRGIEM